MPRYSKEFIAEIKNKLNVSDVVNKFVKLTRRGNEFVGLSPFKSEKTPSFTVNDSKEFYHCFSTSEHGDMFSFMMKHKGYTYPESIEYLASLAGLDPSVGIISSNYNDNFVDNTNLKKIFNDANNFFKNNLANSDPTNKYLIKREISKNIIDVFSLGYASSKSDSLYQFLLSKKFELKDMLESGLIKKSTKNNNEYYDFFRSRLVFPIRDSRSNIIAFGGRALDKSNIKYINSSENKLFKKGYNLYNLDLAIEKNHKIDDLIIVEGYMDVISLYQNGFETTVAPLGTALTNPQIEKAWRYCKSPIICFDGDVAGNKAAYRSAINVLQVIKPEHSIRICSLNDNLDPDDYIKEKGKASFGKLINNAKGLSDFIWENEYSKIKSLSPEDLAGFENRIKSLINEIKDETVKNYYKKDYLQKLQDLRAVKNYQNNNYQNNNYQKPWKKSNFVKISSEILRSERGSINEDSSHIREKVILLCIIENPNLISDFFEEIGILTFNKSDFSRLCSFIVEYASNDNKELEKTALKSYLSSSEFSNIVSEIYKEELLRTYKSLLDSDYNDLKLTFIELLNRQSKIASDTQLEDAEALLAENMDDDSFEKFLKLKKDSFIKEN
jgi:DNA primase|tara:strand:- start:1733 stop:3568 length:1836 start_codon:yes stop_codon:yes gene_type:complete